MSVIPTKWATVCVEYAKCDKKENGRLDCCDSASFMLHQTLTEALNWARANISADQMVAVMEVKSLVAAQAIELKDSPQSNT